MPAMRCYNMGPRPVPKIQASPPKNPSAAKLSSRSKLVACKAAKKVQGFQEPIPEKYRIGATNGAGNNGNVATAEKANNGFGGDSKQIEADLDFESKARNALREGDLINSFDSYITSLALQAAQSDGKAEVLAEGVKGPGISYVPFSKIIDESEKSGDLVVGQVSQKPGEKNTLQGEITVKAGMLEKIREYMLPFFAQTLKVKWSREAADGSYETRQELLDKVSKLYMGEVIESEASTSTILERSHKMIRNFEFGILSILASNVFKAAAIGQIDDLRQKKWRSKNILSWDLRSRIIAQEALLTGIETHNGETLCLEGGDKRAVHESSKKAADYADLIFKGPHWSVNPEISVENPNAEIKLRFSAEMYPKFEWKPEDLRNPSATIVRRQQEKIASDIAMQTASHHVNVIARLNAKRIAVNTLRAVEEGDLVMVNITPISLPAGAEFKWKPMSIIDTETCEEMPGSPSGIKEALLGRKVGDIFNANIKFPPRFGPNQMLANEVVEHKFEIKQIFELREAAPVEKITELVFDTFDINNMDPASVKSIHQVVQALQGKFIKASEGGIQETAKVALYNYLKTKRKNPEEEISLPEIVKHVITINTFLDKAIVERVRQTNEPFEMLADKAYKEKLILKFQEANKKEIEKLTEQFLLFREMILGVYPDQNIPLSIIVQIAKQNRDLFEPINLFDFYHQLIGDAPLKWSSYHFTNVNPLDAIMAEIYYINAATNGFVTERMKLNIQDPDDVNKQIDKKDEKEVEVVDLIS